MRRIGISFTPQNEPSHSLIDKVCQQLEDNVVTYIDLSRYSSRHDEALHSKVDTTLALDSSGGLRLSKKQKLDDVNVTGEHKMRQAFLRRSLAYDLAGIATFSVLDLWKAPLANFRHVSMEQAINGDKALWVKVSNETRGKLQPKIGMEKPFDADFTKFAEHPEVLQHLMPLQSQGGYRSDMNNSATPSAKGKGAHQTGGKGKPSMGKGKASTGITVPDDCEIFVDGKQLCKRWQIGRCTAKVKPGKRCMVGYHMCWKKACHKLHPGNECPH